MTTIKNILLYILLSVLILIALFCAVIYYQYHRDTADLAIEDVPPPITYPYTGEPVNFLIIGDSGSGNKGQKNVAGMLERICRKSQPAGLIIAGDIIYPSGVSSVDDRQWEEKLFSIYTSPCLDTLPVFPVPGNHDYKGNMKAWLEKSKAKRRWKYPSRHYSVIFEDVVTLYALDSMYPVNLEKQGIPNLNRPTTPWTLAVGHHPIQSASASGGGHKGKGIRPWLLKYLLCNVVDDYVAGHAHHLEYSAIEGCGMNQLISGAGGGTLYPIDPQSEIEFAISEFGFLHLEYYKDKSIARYYSDQGKRLFKKIRNRTPNN